MFLNLIYVALGGAVGSVLRYMLGLVATRSVFAGMPVGVLSANILGSFVMGLFVVFATKRGLMHLSPLVMVGFLGGFTTFSAFSLEAVSLFERGAYGTASLYILLSVIGSVAALALGVWIARGVFA